MASASEGHERDRHHDMASPQPKKESWWKIHPFRGMIKDVRRRLPYYVSDWSSDVCSSDLAKAVVDRDIELLQYSIV